LDLKEVEMFFLIWGTKATTSKLGYAADVCPICREVRALRLSRRGMVDHVFYIPLGKPRNSAVVADCPWCEVRFTVDPSGYKEIEKNGDLALPLLVAKTNPGLAGFSWSASAGPDEKPRRETIRDHFLRIDKALEGRPEKADRVTQLSQLAIFVAPLAWGFSVAALPIAEPLRSTLIGVSLLIFFLAFAVSSVLKRSEPKRFYRSRLQPLLVEALKPLRPTVEELDSCLAELRKNKFRVGKLIKPRALELSPAP
jgi:hypothetical protein